MILVTCLSQKIARDRKNNLN